MNKVLWVLVAMCVATSVRAQTIEKGIWEELQKTAVLSALVEQCENLPAGANKADVQKFSKEYSNYLIEKGKLPVDKVIKLVATALYTIDQKYSDDIPQDICLNAVDMLSLMEKQWFMKKEDSTSKQAKKSPKIESFSKSVYNK